MLPFEGAASDGLTNYSNSNSNKICNMCVRMQKQKQEGNDQSSYLALTKLPKFGHG